MDKQDTFEVAVALLDDWHGEPCARIHPHYSGRGMDGREDGRDRRRMLRRHGRAPPLRPLPSPTAH